jgi:signal transduction histidine kinase
MEFLSSESLIPHGHCYLWDPKLVSLHAIADLLTVIAYYAIPIVLIYFVRRRQDIPFGFTLVLFSIFILACGTTHALAVWTLWHPDYWLSGMVKAFTAIVSLYTAIHLVPILPQALAMKSPAELEQINRELEKEIVQRKKVEQELRESERNYRLLVDNMPNGAVLMFDHDLRYTIAGGTELEKIGFSEKSFEQRTLWQVLPTEACKLLEPIYRNALSGNTARSEIPFASYIYDVNSIPVWDEHGEVKAGLILAQNITQQKQAELHMLKTLEQEKQLSDLKSRIVTTVSHQFRNPLAVISMAAEALLKYMPKLSEEKIRKRLQNILVATQSMASLMDEILVFSTIESGKLVFSPQLVNLPALYQNLLQSQFDYVDMQQTENRRAIEIDIDESCQNVYIDPRLVDMALGNLVSNALKYSDPGSPVKLTTSCDRDYITIQVIDAGIGIAPVDLPHIFDPFFRSNSVENIHGTGFGLAIARQAMQVHNGIIDVDSEVGKGTTFTIKIPYLQHLEKRQLR